MNRTEQNSARVTADLRGGARASYLSSEVTAAHADALYEMGARTVNDLSFLEDEDFENLGLDRAAVRVLVQ